MVYLIEGEGDGWNKRCWDWLLQQHCPIWKHRIYSLLTSRMTSQIIVLESINHIFCIRIWFDVSSRGAPNTNSSAKPPLDIYFSDNPRWKQGVNEERSAASLRYQRNSGGHVYVQLNQSWSCGHQSPALSKAINTSPLCLIQTLMHSHSINLF